MSSPTIIDLKVDRNLLNPNFDCYRVSIDPIITYCQPLKSSVDELRLSSDEYSYLHVSMASQLNHLYIDPFSPQTVFVVTNSGQIDCLSIELITGQLSKPQTVYSVPDYSSSLITISFPDHELAVISYSNPNEPCIYLMSTPSRCASQPWILLSKISLIDSEFKLKSPFQLMCSQLTNLYNNSNQIDFIVVHIDKRYNNNNDSKTCQSCFVCVLNWFTISCNGSDSHSIKRFRRLIGSDWPKYLTFDFIGTPMLCIISEKEFKFIEDSEQPIIDDSMSESNVSKDEKIVYTYLQTLEDITVNCKLPDHIVKEDINVEFKPLYITVKIKNEIKLEGELFHTIDLESSVWTLQRHQNYQLLELNVSKLDNGRVWKEFIKGDIGCKEIINQEIIEEVHNKLSHLTGDISKANFDSTDNDLYNPMGLEECDYVESTLMFTRFDGNTHSISHRIDLSGNQWLFSIPLSKYQNSDNNELPYFVIRHDVDALVWSPQSCHDINEFKVSHLSTFNAFGYVQASKTNTRFIVSALDFSFVAIADGLRHVYVYKQPQNIVSGELRNRRTGIEVQTVSNQYVINLSECTSIIGIQATNDCIFVLSTNQVFLIKL